MQPGKIGRIAKYLLVTFFTLMLGSSGVIKAMDLHRFELVLQRLYGGFPSGVYPVLAIGIIGFELVAAVALWYRRTRVAASWAIAVMMWFFVLVHVRILLFFPNLNCGCFGRLFDRPPGFKTLGENIGFLLLAIWMARLASRKIVSDAA